MAPPLAFCLVAIVTVTRFVAHGVPTGEACSSAMNFCMEQSQRQITSGVQNSDTLCKNYNELLSCIVNTGCPLPEASLQTMIDNARSTLKHAAPECELVIPEGGKAEGKTDMPSVPEVDASKTGSDEDVTDMDPAACSSAMNFCMEQSQRQMTSGVQNSDTLCKNYNELVSCIVNTGCPLPEATLQTMIDNARSTLKHAAPECELVIPEGGKAEGKTDMPSVPACYSAMLSCSEQFQRDMTSGGTDPDFICKRFNTFVSCVENSGCPIPEADLQSIIDNARSALEHVAPECELDTLKTGSDEDKTGMSTPGDYVPETTVAYDDGRPNCDSETKLCLVNYQRQLTSGDLDADTMCRNYNTLVSCILNVDCPIPEEAKQMIIDTAQSSLQYVAPDCQLDVPDVKTDGGQTEINDMMMKCQRDITVCTESLYNNMPQGPDVGNYCSYLKTYIACMMSASCGPSTQDKVRSQLDQILQTARDNGLNCGELLDVPSTKATGAATVTVSVEPTNVPSIGSAENETAMCIDALKKCRSDLKESLTQGESSPENICKQLETYVICNVESLCSVSGEEKQDFFNKIRAMVNDSNLPCDISVLSGEVPEVSTTSIPSTEEQTTMDMTTASTDCVIQKWTCGKDFRSSISDASPNDLCSHVNKYVSCLMDIPCPTSPDEKEKILEGARAFVSPKVPGCVVPAPEPEASSASPAEVQTSGKTSAAPAATQDIEGSAVNRTTENIPVSASDSSASSAATATETSTVSSASTPVPSTTEEKPEEICVTDLRVEFLTAQQVLFSWRISTDYRPESLTGFEIMTKVASESQYNMIGVTVSEAADGNGEYSSQLKLKPRSKYSIKVRSITLTSTGPPTQPIYIYVSGRSVGVTPELSVSATPLSPDSVLVMQKALGGGEVANPKFFFKTGNSSIWTPVQKHYIAFQGKESTVLSGLKPVTTYFVMAKAMVDKKSKTAVTSVTTLSQDPPRRLYLAKGDDFVDWSHWNLQNIEGYRATVVFDLPKGPSSVTEIQYLPIEKTILEFPDDGRSVDVVIIEPYGMNGMLKGARVQCIRCDLDPRASKP